MPENEEALIDHSLLNTTVLVCILSIGSACSQFKARFGHRECLMLHSVKVHLEAALVFSLLYENDVSGLIFLQLDIKYWCCLVVFCRKEESSVLKHKHCLCVDDFSL